MSEISRKEVVVSFFAKGFGQLFDKTCKLKSSVKWISEKNYRGNLGLTVNTKNMLDGSLILKHCLFLSLVSILNKLKLILNHLQKRQIF